MAPHQTSVDNHHHHHHHHHHGVSVTKNSNAGKPAATAPYKRDLQSAMQNAPQVRVIHIFAPKVIKTDVASFRATVQRLTGRSKRRSSPRVAKGDKVTTTTTTTTSTCVAAVDDRFQPQGTSYGRAVGALSWEKEELQRLVGDACGVDSDDSLDSGNTVFSGDSSHVITSPSFSFYTPREIPYSLHEIPAPFVHDMHSIFNPSNISMAPMSSSLLPDHGHLLPPPPPLVMDQSHMLGFDVDSVGTTLPLPLPTLSDVGSGGSLFDVLPRHHCRLSVHQPYQGTTNFFESM